MPKGTPKIEVSFDIDADGIIKVSATDKASGKKSSITVFGKTGMSKDEIEKLVNESQSSTKDDQMKMNYLKHVNNLELIAFDSDQALKDWEKFINDEEKQNLSGKIETVKAMIQDSRNGDLFDVDLIKAAQEELKAVTLEIIQDAAKKSRAEKEKENEKN
ncbi:unnamed protein product [Ambrosiozyma monospora]|uniref:Unnamed protein product n=1 Tax=Ambrosiozyma monospora TaxID=43982 RepID=A0ACB5TBF4_AMBMO|nr:unnamed protein product [Ambrosiozyma monospora]